MLYTVEDLDSLTIYENKLDDFAELGCRDTESGRNTDLIFPSFPKALGYHTFLSLFILYYPYNKHTYFLYN